MKHIRIFLASPGDLTEERKIVTEVLEDLRITIGRSKDVYLELKTWETDTYPAIGQYVQKVITEQIGDYDVFVGIMWRRFGTKTPVADSGTEEEFNHAYELFKRFSVPTIMLYFKDSGTIRNETEHQQHGKILAFKKRIADLGALYYEFEDIRQFERRLRIHLYLHLDKMTSVKLPARRLQIFLSHRSGDQSRVEVIYNKLNSAGLKPWMAPMDIRPGSLWKEAINSAIAESDIFLVCLSENQTADSVTGFSSNHELDIAKEINEVRTKEGGGISANRPITIIPILLDNVELPSTLGELQYIDATSEQGIDDMIVKLKKMVSQD